MRLLLLLALLAGCAVPPASSYVSGVGARMAEAVDLGTNSVGEACYQSPGSQGLTDIYCGTWQQPSARVRDAGPADAATLNQLVTASPWRSSLDATFACAPPRSTTLGGNPALQLDCARRVGGWPQVAVAALSGGRAWLADGVIAAMPAVDRSIAVLSGRASPRIVANAAVLARQAEREGARARYAGDYREYASLMAQGARANLADEPAAAQSAYAAALALQEKQFGRESPYAADPVMHVALQLSNQGRYAEADAMFVRAERLARLSQSDPTLLPRLEHYEGLHAMNQGKYQQGLALLQQAEAGYTRGLPPDVLRPQPTAGTSAFENRVQSAFAVPQTDQIQLGLSGLIEVRRYEGVILRFLNRPAESEAMLRSAAELASRTGLEQPALQSRLARSVAVTASARGERDIALEGLRESNQAFARAYPGSRPLALVGLLRAHELVAAGRSDAAIPVCRSSIQVLQGLRSGFEPERMTGCLQAFSEAAAQGGEGASRQALLRDMFLAAQLVRGTTTSQQIQLASARLSESSRNPQVAEAIRAQQDSAAQLASVTRRREAIAEQVRTGAALQRELAALDEEERSAAAELATRESAVQAAAPNYGQLIQQAVTAEDVFRALAPGEAFVSIALTPDAGWVFLLRDNTVRVVSVPNGARAVDPLVARIRKAVLPETPPFDTDAARTLYSMLLAGFGPGLEGVRAMTVAPSGTLLSLPFSVLLTGPASNDNLAAAPWLVRQMAIGHVPSAGNFVSLRRAQQASATRPWFGFGDFHPVTLAQARRSFGPGCGDTAELLAHLPPLPSARQELARTARLFGASPDEELLGAAFTAGAVERADLSRYRVLHFATHALLPSDLKCQSEPALITSPPPGAADASGALLTASDLAQIKLDADLVILSACNSGGADGLTLSGESLSALARSFFFGGARSLLITHWEVSDKLASFLVIDTLTRLKEQPALGVSGALQASETGFLDRVARGVVPAELAHPFFWAPFALIGPATPPGAAARTAFNGRT